MGRDMWSGIRNTVSGRDTTFPLSIHQFPFRGWSNQPELIRVAQPFAPQTLRAPAPAPSERPGPPNPQIQNQAPSSPNSKAGSEARNSAKTCGQNSSGKTSTPKTLEKWYKHRNGTHHLGNKPPTLCLSAGWSLYILHLSLPRIPKCTHALGTRGVASGIAVSYCRVLLKNPMPNAWEAKKVTSNAHLDRQLGA